MKNIYDSAKLFNDGRTHSHCVILNGRVITNAAMHKEDAAILRDALNKIINLNEVIDTCIMAYSQINEI